MGQHYFVIAFDNFTSSFYNLASTYFTTANHNFTKAFLSRPPPPSIHPPISSIKSIFLLLTRLVLRVLHLISIHKYLCALTLTNQPTTQRIYQISIWAYKQSFYPVPKLCKIQILVSSCLSINQQFFVNIKKFLSADAHRSLKISNFHKELSLLSLKVLNWSP